MLPIDSEKKNSKPPKDAPGGISVPDGGGPGNEENASILAPMPAVDSQPAGSDKRNPVTGNWKSIA
jgi:hypothetical protein